MKKEFEKPVLTDSAVFFLETFGKGVISKDFVGFVVNLNPRFDALLLITLKGIFRPFPTSPKKPLSIRLYKKIYKKLRKTGFIREGCMDPFPDFEPYSNMRLNPYRTLLINDYIFGKMK